MARANTSNKPVKSRKGIGGRPTKFTPETLKKLEEAFSIGASDREACFYADVSTVALYAYQKDNPEFVNRKEALKERPVLLARQSVLKGINTDPNLALKYLERKLPKEFSLRRELTGADGKDLPAPIVNLLELKNIMDDKEMGFIEHDDDMDESGKSTQNRALIDTPTPIEPEKSRNIMDDIK